MVFSARKNLFLVLLFMKINAGENYAITSTLLFVNLLE